MEIHAIILINPLLLLTTGLLLLFCGKSLVKFTVGLTFGTVISFATYNLLMEAGLNQHIILLLSLLIFFIGFTLGWVILKGILSIIIGIPLGLLLASTFNVSTNVLLTLVTIAICIAIAYILAEKIVSLATFLAGVSFIIWGLITLNQSPLVVLLVTSGAIIVKILLKIRRVG